MDFSSLLEQYLARHWRSVSDDILTHLKGFAAHCEGAAADLAERAESAAAAVMSQVADAIAPPTAPLVEAAPETNNDDPLPEVASPAAAVSPAADDMADKPEADVADDQPAAA